MKITLAVPRHIKLYCAKLDSFRWWIWNFLACIWILEVFATFAIWRERVFYHSLGLLIATGLLIFLFGSLRRHRLLSWKVNQLAEDFREPRVVDLKTLASDLLRFERFSSVIIVFLLVSACVYPYAFTLESLSYFNRQFATSKYGFYLAVWQVHATLLGFFVVFLTFVFQMVSVRTAYETSLLPFFARRERFGPIIGTNFVFLFIDSIGLMGDDKFFPTTLFRYLSLIGFIFALLSALFLFYRVLELLKPDSLEQGLSELIQSELVSRLEEEQNSGLTAHVLIEECRLLDLEFSPFDSQLGIPALRPNRGGTVTDVDLDELKRFAHALTGRVDRGTERTPKAIILKTVGDDVNSGAGALARVSRGDATDTNTARLNRCFRIVES
jgi:hypothetical protein